MSTWQRRAACAHPSVQPKDFSPVDSRGRVDLARAQAVATRICGVCPVRAECVAWAVEQAANGHAPQEVVLGGLWFPAGNATDTTLINLLTDQRQETAA